MLLDDAVYHFELWQLQRKKQQLRKFHQRLSDKAIREKAGHEKLGDLTHNEIRDVARCDAEIYQLQTRYLLRLAEYYVLPTPGIFSNSDAWTKSSVTERYHLTIAAITELRAAVRKEQEANRSYWIGWITALTGLVGALIGLISLWGK